MKDIKKDLQSMPNEGIENVSSDERRHFLKMGLMVTGVFAGGSLLSVVSNQREAFASTGQFVEQYPYKPHYSMVVHVDRCVDCERCLDACRATNEVPDGNYRTNVLERTTAKAVDQQREFIPVLCNHCNLPQCTRVCPTKATYKDEKNGIVMMDTAKCIGCLTCQLGCPYNARYFNEEIHAVDKCNFCFDTRLSKGEKLTACTNACPAQCRVFGDLSNPRDELYRTVHQTQRKVWVLRPEVATKPNIFYTVG